MGKLVEKTSEPKAAVAPVVEEDKAVEVAPVEEEEQTGNHTEAGSNQS